MRSHKNLLVFSLVAFLAIATFAKADIAAPFATINVTYNGGVVNGNFSAVMLECVNSSMVNNVTSSFNATEIPRQLNISEYDPAHGCYWIYSPAWWQSRCSDSACFSEYFPPSAFKMAFYIPSLNRTFITNEIDNANYQTTNYNVQLYQNGSATMAVSGNNIPFDNIWAYQLLGIVIMALAITIIVEIPVAFAYLKIIKVRKIARILITLIVVNIISVPILWFVFIFLLGLVGIILGEIFAVVFEGFFIYYFNKKGLDLKNAMLMSLIMNIASFLIGFGLLFLGFTI